MAAAFACGAPPDEAPVSSSASALHGTGGTPFVDACALPGMVAATFVPYAGFDAADEGATTARPLPFPFTFFGEPQTQYWVTSNGEIGFGSVARGPDFGLRACLPEPHPRKPLIGVYSSDLISWNVCMATTGSAPSRKLVVTWKEATHYEWPGGAIFTFGAQLSEGTNRIDWAVESARVPPGLPPDPWIQSFVTGQNVVLGAQSSGSASVKHSCYEPKAGSGATFFYQP